jgi:TolB-like protein
MLTRTSKFRLCLLGPFNLENPDGQRISIPSRKGAALIAMLAVSKGGERARGWLQTQLWGSREFKEASGSLRRELSELRKRLNDPSCQLLICERDRVRLDLSIVCVDIFERDERAHTGDFGRPGEFLEGFDIPGEENFEEWLRTQRNRVVELAANCGRSVPGMPHPLAFSDSPPSVPSEGEDHSLSVPESLVGPTPPLSMVVLPFKNIGGDQEQEYFVDGVTESLTTDLSRIVGLFVIGRSTAFTYKGKVLDLRQIGRELGVRYLLQGSVQRGSNRLRVNVQLVDAETGTQLWAERFDKPVADLFEVQDEIISRLANQLEAQLIEVEARRSERSPNPSSMELYFQGRALVNKGFTLEYLTPARVSFERALIVDPKNIEPMIGTAIVDSIFGSMSDDGAALLAKAEATLLNVLSRAPNHAFAHLIWGGVLISTKRADQGIAECERALTLDSNLAEAHAAIGRAKYTLGRGVETEAHMNQALRLSPRDVFAYRWLYLIGLAKLALHEDAEALSWFRRSVETNRNHWWSHFYLAAALALLGSLEQARAAARAGLAINPGFTIRRYRVGATSDNPIYLAARERHYEGMRLAGVPEG